MALRDFRSQYHIWDERADYILGWTLIMGASCPSANVKPDTHLR